MKGMKGCLGEKENETLPARAREDGNGVIRKEDKWIRVCVVREVDDYVERGQYEFVMDNCP